MNNSAKIYVAGHRGLVGSALVRNLRAKGYCNLLLRTRDEVDLRDQASVEALFREERPDYVFLAAATVGGIHANNTYPATFIRDNLAIQTNVIHAAHLSGVERLLFLGSSCIYPKNACQPMSEDCLLTGPLEASNRPYAVAKIAGIEMCWSYNRQYRTKYLAVMPTNLFGPGDDYHPENSHVIPALIRKFHEGKLSNSPFVTVWGTGTPRREFLYSDDMADACVFLMNLPEERYLPLLGQDRNDGRPPLLNIGTGSDMTIADLAQCVREVVGYEGEVTFDATKLDGTPRKLLDVTGLMTLGWRPLIPFREGLERAYEDFCMRVFA